MRAEPIRDEMARDQNGESWWSRHGRLGLTIASAGLTASAFLIHLGLANSAAEVFGSEGMGNAHAVPLPLRILYLLAVLSSVYHVIPKAWFVLRRVRPDMNLLMVIAVCGTIAIGDRAERCARPPERSNDGNGS